MSMTYDWEGVTEPGHPAQRGLGATRPKRVRGTDTTDGDEATVSRNLRARGIHPSSIRPHSRLGLLDRFRTVKTEHQLTFYESMAFLENTSLQRSLAICARRCRDPHYATAIAGAAHDVANGVAIDDAFSRHPQEFDNLQCAMVRAGRESAELPATFRNLAKMLGNLYKTQTSVKDALRGPAILSLLSLAGLVFMLVWFVPQMELMLSAVHTAIPAPTVFVIWLSQMASNILTWIVLGGGAAAAYVGWRYFMSEPRNAVAWERLLAKTPVLGTLMEQHATARVARVLAVVSRAVNSSRAVDLVVPLATSSRHRLALEQIARDCREGVSIDAAFARVDAFDPMLAQYLETGRISADISGACDKVADFLEREVQRGTDALTAAIEPLLTVVISTAFTLLVLALYLPYLALLTSLNNGGGQ